MKIKDTTDCMDCPNRKDGFCGFYKETLEVFGNLYLPCEQCEEEYSLCEGAKS
mgnify:FL=1|jgi:hypothetical protein